MTERPSSIESQKTKLSTKLMLAFGLVIALCAIQAIIASNMLTKTKGTLAFLVDDRMAKVNQLGHYKDHVGTVSNSVRNISLLEDDNAVAAEKGKIASAQSAKVEIINQLTATITTAQGKQRLQTLKDAEKPFEATLQEFLSLTQAGKRDQALSILLGSFKDSQARYQEVTRELIDYQIELSEGTVANGQQGIAATKLTLLGLALFALLLGGLIAWMIARGISKQLGGEPQEASEVAQRVAAGDLSIRVQLKPGDTKSLMAQLDAMQASLTSVVDRVRNNAAAVADTSAEIASGNIDLSSRTERQAASLQETAASMEQISSTVRQNAESAREANQLAVGASTVATKGGEVVEQVIKNMKGIDDSSKRIADILSVIDGIAFQTNILALNAAVEAARAGDHGRGFAVVATEVRSLAQRSAEAAKEIKSLIEESVERVSHGSNLVDQAGSTMVEIVASISRVTQIMGEIANASTEQSAGVAQVGDAVTEMDKATQQNAALVEESAAASETMREKATELVEVVSVFKLGEPEEAPTASA